MVGESRTAHEHQSKLPYSWLCLRTGHSIRLAGSLLDDLFRELYLSNKHSVSWSVRSLTADWNLSKAVMYEKLLGSGVGVSVVQISPSRFRIIRSSLVSVTYVGDSKNRKSCHQLKNPSPQVSGEFALSSAGQVNFGPSSSL